MHRKAEIIEYWFYKPRNAEDGRQPPEARGDKEGFLSQSLQREHAPADILISDYENKFVTFSHTVYNSCLGSPRKVITYVYGRLDVVSNFSQVNL